MLTRFDVFLDEFLFVVFINVRGDFFEKRGDVPLFPSVYELL